MGLLVRTIHGVQKSESSKILQKTMLLSSTEICVGQGKHFNYHLYSFRAFLFYIDDSLMDANFARMLPVFQVL
jgi:hypothetical protein